jgi:hypothetical protein
VRGVGSGSLNTMRQVGFTVGVALLVAVFTHTAAQNAQQATRTSAAVIARTVPSPALQGAYTATLLGNARAAAGSGGGAAKMTTDPLQGAPQPPGSSPAAFEKLNATVAGIYRDDIAESFTWPFYAAALAALAAIVPALMTGRRLGEHEGHHEMTRSERLEAAGTDEAAQPNEPKSDA